MVVQLILVGPPIEEDEIRCAPVVDAEKTHTVAALLRGWLRQTLARYSVSGRDQFRPRRSAPVSDAVYLQPPAMQQPEL